MYESVKYDVIRARVKNYNFFQEIYCHTIYNYLIDFVEKVSTNPVNKTFFKDFPFLGLDKSVFTKENDWWVESGGPPVTNEGKIATDLDLDQYPEKTEDQYLCE